MFKYNQSYKYKYGSLGVVLFMNIIFMASAILACLMLGSYAQLGRDITLKFLKLDQDSNYLLDTSELKHIFDHEGPKKYFHLDEFKK